MAIIVMLFFSGYRTAKERNTETDTSTYYNSKRTVSDENPEQQHARIQKMRDDGLISGQEFDKKNAKVDSQKQGK